MTRRPVELWDDFTRSIRIRTRRGVDYFFGTTLIVQSEVCICERCVVGAISAFIRDVPPGSMVAGNPARVIRSIRTDAFGKKVESTNSGQT